MLKRKKNIIAPQAESVDISHRNFGEESGFELQSKGSKSKYDIQLILVSGYNEPERCTAALLMAMVCATSFDNVLLFLMMNAVELAAKQSSKRIKVEPFDYINNYIDSLESMEVNIEVCSTCIRKFCTAPYQELPHDYLRPEAKIASMYEYAARAKDVRTLMF